MDSDSLSTRSYYPLLDILRGVAISLVVLYHLFDSVSILRIGWIGVDLFFVLSGFLITDFLLKSIGTKFYFRNFYMRRFLRIFPLYYLTLLVFYLLSPYFFSERGPSTTFSYYNQNQLWFWTYFQNWLLVEKGPAPVPYLSHFWSLAVEEQFYVLWPVIVFLLKKLKYIRICAITLICFALLLRCYTWFQNPLEVEKYYCSTLTRMDSLLMGCLLAVYIKEGRCFSFFHFKILALACVLLIISSVVFVGHINQNSPILCTIGYTVFAAFFSMVLYFCIKQEKKISYWPKQMKLFSFIGKISYGVYVYHIPIYLVISTQLYRIVRYTFNTPVFISALSIIITVIISLISFHFVERPILHLKKYFS